MRLEETGPKIKKILEKLQNFPDKKKKIILWTIVVVLALIMGIFWVRGTIDKVKYIGKSVSQIKIPEVQTSLPALESTADWQTYTNDKYGFEIKIPKDWIIQEVSNGLNLTTDALLKEKQKNHICLTQHGTNCDAGELPYAVAYFQFMAKDGDKYSADDLVNGISMVQLGGIDWHRYATGGMLSDIHFRITNDKVEGYDFDVYMDTDENIMKTVLSTFKFTPVK